jgi:hypothetical protein
MRDHLREQAERASTHVIIRTALQRVHGEEYFSFDEKIDSMQKMAHLKAFPCFLPFLHD